MRSHMNCNKCKKRLKTFENYGTDDEPLCFDCSAMPQENGHRLNAGLQRPLADFMKWWGILTSIFFATAVFTEKTGYHQFTGNVPPLSWRELTTTLPEILIMSIVLGFIGSFMRKVYYLINNLIVNHTLSSEPVRQRRKS